MGECFIAERHIALASPAGKFCKRLVLQVATACAWVCGGW